MKLSLTGMLMLVTAAGAAQEPLPRSSPEALKVVVTLGDTAAPPEWHLSVPVAVKIDPETDVGWLSVRVAYPAKVLAYGKVRPTDTLKKAGFEVTGAADKTRPRAKDVTSIAVEFKPRTSGARLPRSGTLAILEFKVAADAPQKTWPITVEDVRARTGLPARGEVNAASGGPAKFLVTPPGLPILSCFFYMH